MSRFVGTVKKNDLEGGFWELVDESGNRYQLEGGDEGLRAEGQRVSIEGEVAADTMGIGMVGSTLRVRSWQPA